MWNVDGDEKILSAWKMSRAKMSAYINETVLCGKEDGFTIWDEKGNFGNCFQDLILVIPSQVSLMKLFI